MKREGPRNIVASIQARLVQRSHELDIEHQLTLARFGCERLLYRLSKFHVGGELIGEWDAFVGRIRGAGHPDFSEVIGGLRAFLWPALEAAATSEPWHREWEPGGPWK